MLQAPHFERRGDNRREYRYPTGQRGQPGGRGRGTHPITPQVTAVNQGQFFGSSFSPAPYTNPVNNTVTNGFSHGTPHWQAAPSNSTPPPRDPPGHHHHHHHYPHTQSSPLIRGYPALNPGSSYNMEAPRAPPAFPLDVTQATQEGIGGSMAAMGSIRQPALSPQAGSVDVFPIQRRHSLPCPVSHCPTSLSRTQDQRRHLLTHLPHCIHCPAPDCSWRGDRPNAFARHWNNDHPPGIQVPNEGHCRTYDPQPLMRSIAEGTLCIQDAQKYAISMVKQRAWSFKSRNYSKIRGVVSGRS
jgi:hypothetical protein